VALVTGSARRVGRAIALDLARAGFDLVVHHRTSTAEAAGVVLEAESMGVAATAVRADLSAPAEIAAMFAEVERLHGRLDVLVNSAAVFRRTPPATLDEEAFDFHVGVNLKAPYLCCIHAARLMRGPSPGRIVNVADVAAERPMRNYVPYCVSKAGLVMLTRSLAKALAPAVLVNAVAPGTVLFREDEGEPDRARVIARIPRGRVGAPEDVAAAVRFLCEGSEHVTGAVIPVDGGRALD
jgi:NAD(P)-dependent dehydrogenase (short-subunit alcohol dehydrogenase family)